MLAIAQIVNGLAAECMAEIEVLLAAVRTCVSFHHIGSDGHSFYCQTDAVSCDLT
jgi:hypothetical protein